MTEQGTEFDFGKTPLRRRKPCSQCNDVFRGTDEEQLCPQCLHRKEYPEDQDQHWTWRRAGGRWEAIAYWPHGEPLPQPGDRITVHRRDGSTTTAVVREADLRYTSTGRGRVQCIVE